MIASRVPEEKQMAQSSTKSTDPSQSDKLESEIHVKWWVVRGLATWVIMDEPLFYDAGLQPLYPTNSAVSYSRKHQHYKVYSHMYEYKLVAVESSFFCGLGSAEISTLQEPSWFYTEKKQTFTWFPSSCLMTFIKNLVGYLFLIKKPTIKSYR